LVKQVCRRRLKSEEFNNEGCQITQKAQLAFDMASKKKTQTKPV
jgi:hypothetical protein